MGALQGPIMPAFIQILSAWVPVAERGFLGGFAFSGMTVGIWHGFIWVNPSDEEVPQSDKLRRGPTYIKLNYVSNIFCEKSFYLNCTLIDFHAFTDLATLKFCVFCVRDWETIKNVVSAQKTFDK